MRRRVRRSEIMRMDWSGFRTWLTETPPALTSLFLFAAAAAALLIGRALGARFKRPMDDEPETLVVSAVFGLLALLLGFTFALTIDRYEARRILVQEEANAINTAFTRAQLLGEPHRSRISDILMRYAENRVALARTPPPANRTMLATNDRLVSELWSASAAAFPSIRELDFSSTFIESVNGVINLEATRKSARVARVPVEVFALLITYVVASAGVLGMMVRSNRAFGLAALFVALLTLSLSLVIDIDRPAIGGVREQQGPMERLLVAMKAQHPR